MMTYLIANSEFIQYEIKPNSACCFIHFSSRNTQKSKFNKWPTPYDSSNIYINSASNDWYVNGLPCWGVGLNDSFREFGKLLDHLSNKKIILLGSSMGAFGSSLFASKFHLDLICFAPELFLNIFSGFSSADKLSDCPRIEDIGPGPKRALLFAGLNQPSDVVCGSYFSNLWHGSNCVYFSGCGHATGKFLKEKNLLAEVIDRFSNGLGISDSVQGISYNNAEFFQRLPPNPNQFDEVHLGNYLDAAFERFKLSDLIETCGNLIARRVFNPPLRIIDKILAKYGPISEVMILRAQCLRRLGRNDDAYEVFASLRSNKYFGATASLGIAMIANRKGMHDAERDEYKRLIKLTNTNLASYNELIKKSNIPAGYENFPENHLHGEFTTSLQQAESLELNLVRVDELLAENKVDEARNVIEIGLEIFPHSQALKEKFVRMAQSQGDWPSAVEQLEKLFEIKEGNPSTWLISSLIQAHRNAKNFDRADFYAEQGLKLYPHDPLILSEYAWTAQTLKNWPLALSCLQHLKAVNSGASRDKTYQRLAQAYHGCGLADDAKRTIIEGLSRFPDSQRLLKAQESLSASA